MAQVVLDTEVEELGIQAGLQDRVIQVRIRTTGFIVSLLYLNEAVQWVLLLLLLLATAGYC